MRRQNHKVGQKSLRRGQRGFTLIETLVVVTLSAILFIGFRYTFQVFSEQINRSWSQRYLEQYGNSLVEYIARNVINARQITLGSNQGSYGVFYVTLTDPFAGNYQVTYSSSGEGIKENNQYIFPEYYPQNAENSVNAVLGPREEFSIEQFKGEFIYRPYPPYANPPTFNGRVFQVTLTLKYTRQGDKDFNDYIKIMTFKSQVSLKMRDTSTQGQPGSTI